MKKYIIVKEEQGGGYLKYDGIIVYLTDENKNKELVFICDCGDWYNKRQRKTAKMICDLLNGQLIK